MVASDTGTLARVASSKSISAVRWRSPLPNSSQPSAMRWRVGRKPTWRRFALTSCHGQPVISDRSELADTTAGLAEGNTIRRLALLRPKTPARLGPGETCLWRKIYAFTELDATLSQLANWALCCGN